MSEHEYRGDGCLSCERADAYADFWQWWERQEGRDRTAPMQLAWLAFQAGWHIPQEQDAAFDPPPKETHG